jgi:uncharacterized membrane protein
LHITALRKVALIAVICVVSVAHMPALYLPLCITSPRISVAVVGPHIIVAAVVAIVVAVVVIVLICGADVARSPSRHYDDVTLAG